MESVYYMLWSEDWITGSFFSYIKSLQFYYFMQSNLHKGHLTNVTEPWQFYTQKHQ